MTCGECERIWLDSTNRPTKEAWMPGVSILALAESHAQNCPACASKLSDLAKLRAAFDELRASTKRMEAPAWVEANLRAAFRQEVPRQSASVIGTNAWRLVWASTAALLLLVSGVLLYTTLRPKPGISESVKPENKRPAQVVPQQSSPMFSVRRAAATVPQSGRSGAKHRRPPKSGANLVAHTNLVPGATQPSPVLAGEQLALNGGSNVIRVNLPLSSLAAVGVPMIPDLPDRQVTADVAMDPFGAVIAIRLVEMKPGEGGLAN
jgi:hypothetical protein